MNTEVQNDLYSLVKKTVLAYFSYLRLFIYYDSLLFCQSEQYMYICIHHIPIVRHEYVQYKLCVPNFQVETDFLPLMSALLVLIVLLPMIPALIGSYLQDIFEVFRYYTVIILHVGLISVSVYQSGYFLNLKIYIFNV